jgi:DNA-binding NarL/FixJ family response regulator
MIPASPQIADGTPTNPSPRRWHVALVEDLKEMRESWTHLINSLPEFVCDCVCFGGEEALQSLPRKNPDVILMDIFMPRMSGIECTAQLKLKLPKTPIVILTTSDDDEIIFLALQAGADGYLLKHTKPADLRAALLDAVSGGAPMSSGIARRVIETFRKKEPRREESAALTAREEEALLLLTKGYGNKEIADKLGVSIETVRSHLKHIYEKLHVRSRAEAVAHYLIGQPR